MAKQRDDTWSNYVRQVNYENQARSYANATNNLSSQKKTSLLSTLIGTASSVYGSANSFGGNVNSGISSGIFGSDYGLGSTNNGISLGGTGNFTVSTGKRKVLGNGFLNMGW